MASSNFLAYGRGPSWERKRFSITFMAGLTSPQLRSSTFMFAGCARSLPKQPAAVTTFRPSGARAMCCVSRRQCRPWNSYWVGTKSLHAIKGRAQELWRDLSTADLTPRPLKCTAVCPRWRRRPALQGALQHRDLHSSLPPASRRHRWSSMIRHFRTPNPFPPGVTDLQSWTHDDGPGALAPDWSRLGTDITKS